MPAPEPRMTIQDVTMASGSCVMHHDLTCTIQPGEIFIIMGGSGCGGASQDPAGYLPRAEDARLPPAGGGRHNHGGVRREPGAHGRAGERNEGLWEVRSIRP